MLLGLILSGYALVERTFPYSAGRSWLGAVSSSGQAGSVSPPKLPLPGLRQRSRAHFLVKVCQGYVECWYLNSLGMEKAR